MQTRTRKHNQLPVLESLIRVFQQFLQDKQIQIDHLKNLNYDLIQYLDELQSHISEKDTLTNYLLSGEMHRAFQCTFPPYEVAKKLNVTSRAITKLADILEMTNDDRLVIRVSRVNKPNPQKYETIVLFSPLGIECLRYGLNQLKIEQQQLLFEEWVAEEENEISEIGLSQSIGYDLESPIDTRELMLASESALKKIWDTPEEDEAWQHL